MRDVSATLWCFPKEGEALPTCFEVVCFLLPLVPCSLLGSWPCVWDSGSGLRRCEHLLTVVERRASLRDLCS